VQLSGCPSQGLATHRELLTQNWPLVHVVLPHGNELQSVRASRQRSSLPQVAVTISPLGQPS
jgi:hypothetical protein